MTESWGFDDVAAHLGVHLICRWIEHRTLPAPKIGKLWKLKLSEVDAWVRTRGTREKSPAGALSPARAKNPRLGCFPERSVSSIPVIVRTTDRSANVSGAVVLRKPLKLDQRAIETLLVQP